MSLLSYSHSSILTQHSEAWRYTGPFSRGNRFKGSFPGFGIALGAFAVYVAYDKLIADHGHHDHHGEEHH
jgi:NADH dehydrogenase (ubiquinone) 1 beta subcomplex subunit 3